MKANEKGVANFFKPNSVVFKVFFIIVFFSVVLQYWLYNHACLKIICEPILVSILYYIFWPIDLINIALLSTFLTTNSIVLFMYRILFLLLQICFWYLLACIIAYPIKKGLMNIEKLIEKKEAEKDKEMKAKISHDLKRAEEFEKSKIKTS